VIAWPANRIGEALEALARRSDLRPKSIELPAPPANIADDPHRLGLWIESAASALGLEAEPEEIRYADIETRLAAASPAVVRCSDGRLLALLDAATVLGPDLEAHRLGSETIAAELCADAEAPFEREVDDLLESAAIPERRRERVHAALMHQRLAGARIGHAWLLRLPPGSSFRLQLRLARIPRRLAMLAGAHSFNTCSG